MKLRSTAIVAQLAADGHADLDTIEHMWALVAANKLLASHLRLTTPLPVAEGCDRRGCSGAPHGDWPYRHAADRSGEAAPDWPYTDPTGETACGGRLEAEDGDQRAQLEALDALARLRRAREATIDALARLRKAATALDGRLPAPSAALRAGREATDGRSAAEIDAKKRGAVEAPSACLVCDLATAEVGPLTAGLCAEHYDAMAAAGWPERTGWITAARAEYQAWLERQIAEVVPLRVHVDPAEHGRAA